jgi:hypothetical protein
LRSPVSSCRMVNLLERLKRKRKTVVLYKLPRRGEKMGHDTEPCPKHYGRASLHVMQEDTQTQGIVLEHQI